MPSSYSLAVARHSAFLPSPSMPHRPSKGQRRLQFSLRTLFVCMTVFAVIMGTVLWRVRRSRDSAQTEICQRHLKELLFTFHNADDCRVVIPAHTEDSNGRRTHSWRVLSLRYSCGYGALYNEYRLDEPWDGPHNGELGTQMPSCYRCPADWPGRKRDATSYLAVVGPGTAWGEATLHESNHFAKDAVGTAVLVEAAGSGIHWMEPRDMELDGASSATDAQPSCGISSLHANGANVLFRDGSVRCIPRSTSPEIIQAMLTTGKAPTQGRNKP